MNLANKITMVRIILSLVIIVILLFPFSQLGIDFPTFLHNDIYINSKYLIAGGLFIIAALTDFFDGMVARKYNMITDFGKMIDAISDKILTNSVLIILACQGMISPVIAVVIIIRDTIVDALKMIVGNKRGAVAAIGIAKLKTASLMTGITLALFYNFPFALFNLEISDYILIIAAILSVVSGIEYYNMSKDLFTER